MVQLLFLVQGKTAHPDSSPWNVAAFTNQEEAASWASKAQTVARQVIKDHGEAWFELIDGPCFEAHEEAYFLYREGRMEEQEYINSYYSQRRKLVLTYNPYDADMMPDTEFWTEISYAVVPLLLNPTLEEEKLSSEDQKEKSVERPEGDSGSDQ